MTKGLTAWKYFLKVLPTATSQTAVVIMDAIGSIGSLCGMYSVKASEKFDNFKDYDQHLEDCAHPRFSIDGLLIEFFGIDRRLAKDKNFDPVELKDSLGYNPSVIKMFRKRDRELGFKRGS